MHITHQKFYKPGDQSPEGYLAWHEWARVQQKAGLRQRRCPRCGKYRYPQEPCMKHGLCSETTKEA